MGGTFDHCSFFGNNLRRSRFADSTLRDTRFVAAELAETGWLDTSLTACALAGCSGVRLAAATRHLSVDCKLDRLTSASST